MFSDFFIAEDYKPSQVHELSFPWGESRKRSDKIKRQIDFLLIKN